MYSTGYIVYIYYIYVPALRPYQSVVHASLHHQRWLHDLSLVGHWGWDNMGAIFQTTFSNNFLEGKCMNFDYDSTESCSQCLCVVITSKDVLIATVWVQPVQYWESSILGAMSTSQLAMRPVILLEWYVSNTCISVDAIHLIMLALDTLVYATKWH